MKILLAVPMLALAACATAAPPTAFGVVPGHHCDAAAGQSFVGQAASADLGRQIVAATHSASIRWAPIGVMLTMIFIDSRVTVRLDQDNKLLAVNCG